MKSIINGFKIPAALCLAIEIPELLEWVYGWSFSHHGLYPRDFGHLYGILTMPFLHGEFGHLANNASALLVLLWLLFEFYKPLAWKSLIWIWLFSGVWLWIGGRANYHIGASAIVYGLAGFLFVGGIFRKHLPLMGVSMLVLFLYGSIIWGIFPVKAGVSWDGHLFGLLAGVSLSYLYRKQGPQRKAYSWDLEDDDGIEDGFWNQPIPSKESELPQNQLPKKSPTRFRYIYRSKNPPE
jgi:membrane associated rhomboid family serine protease